MCACVPVCVCVMYTVCVCVCVCVCVRVCVCVKTHLVFALYLCPHVQQLIHHLQVTRLRRQVQSLSLIHI